MNNFNMLINNESKMAVIGLGYVGMPIAIAFAKKIDVIGFDINKNKIERYKNGIDDTNEVGSEELTKTTLHFTSNQEELKEANFYIVAVPTPINIDKTPDLKPVEGASRLIGQTLTKGDIVVYESTVYPGVTEDICAKILEEESGLKCGVDFKIGYSPERINPGDKIHRLENIVKIVSGMDDETMEEVSKVYELVIEAGVFKASSIKVAEAAKVVENSQRDINIAFMNELAKVFDMMEIDSKDVIDAMQTKWNSLNFYPGLVGGHCIGVDPYYFVYEAEKLGYHSQIVLSGRRINDNMSNFIADRIIKELIKSNKVVSKARVAVLGLTFKENTPDTRNSKIFDVVKELMNYSIEPILYDPLASKEDVKNQYGFDIVDYDQLKDLDCLILAVPHDQLKSIDLKELEAMFNKDLPQKEKIIIDIKSMLDIDKLKESGITFWRL